MASRGWVPVGPAKPGAPAPGALERNRADFPARATARLGALYAEYRAAAADPADPGHRWALALKYYQYLCRAVMSDPEYGVGADGNGRGLLLYEAMGMGKTRIAVAIAMATWDQRPSVVLLARGLRGNFIRTLREVVALVHTGPPDTLAAAQEEALARFTFASLDAYNAADQIAGLDGRLLIIDEAHSFFRAVINGAANARRIYEAAMAARDLRLVFLTGTPVSKDPFELVPCFNLLARRELLPARYEVFYQLYVDKERRGVLNRRHLAARLVGLVSHVAHDRPVAPAGAGGAQGAALFAEALDSARTRGLLVVRGGALGPPPAGCGGLPGGLWLSAPPAPADLDSFRVVGCELNPGRVLALRPEAGAGFAAEYGCRGEHAAPGVQGAHAAHIDWGRVAEKHAGVVWEKGADKAEDLPFWQAWRAPGGLGGPLLDALVWDEAALARRATLAERPPATRDQGWFPEKRPTIVERVEMGAAQYRRYLLAREREEAEKEGGPGGAGAPRQRAALSAPLTLPGAERKVSSSYYVRSRSLSNFAVVLRGHEKTPVDALPDEAFTAEAAPKLALVAQRALRAPGPVLIYSQFVDAGGLRPLARFLRLAGFEPFVLPTGGGEIETESNRNIADAAEPKGRKKREAEHSDHAVMSEPDLVLLEAASPPQLAALARIGSIPEVYSALGRGTPWDEAYLTDLASVAAADSIAARAGSAADSAAARASAGRAYAAVEVEVGAADADAGAVGTADAVGGPPSPGESSFADEAAGPAARRYYHWVVLQEGRVAGYVGLRPARWTPALQLRYFVDPALRGRGIAGRAVARALAAYAQAAPSAEVWALVAPGNAASARVLAKLGFREAPPQAGLGAFRRPAAAGPGFPFRRLYMPAFAEMAARLAALARAPPGAWAAPREKRLALVERSFPGDYESTDSLTDWEAEPARIRCAEKGQPSPAEAWALLAPWPLPAGARAQRELVYHQARGCNLFNPALGCYLLAGPRGPAGAACRWGPGPGGPGDVLDPAAGWGDRLGAAHVAGARSYRGWDTNSALQPVYAALSRRYAEALGTELPWSVQAAPFEDADVPPGSADTVLTSPPFYDQELYEGAATSTTAHPGAEAWYRDYYRPMWAKAAQALRPGGRAIAYISPQLFAETDRALRAGGLQYVGAVGFRQGAVGFRQGAVGGRKRQAGSAGTIRDAHVWRAPGADLALAPTQAPQGGAPETGAPRYAVITGEIPPSDRETIVKAANSPENVRGGVIKALLVSKAGAEGLDLKYVRETHQVEPYWDRARDDQVHARAVRLGSHDALPRADREVQPYLYVATAHRATREAIPERGREVATVDEKFEERAAVRGETNAAFCDLLKEVSLECSLFGYGECFTCAPSGAPLFSADPAADLQREPCAPPRAAEVEATPAPASAAGGRALYYVRDPANPLGFRFFEHRPDLGGHVALDPADPVVPALLRALADSPAPA